MIRRDTPTKNTQSDQIHYKSFCENLEGLAAQSGLPNSDVANVVINQMVQLATKNYIEEHPGSDPNIVIEQEGQFLVCYLIDENNNKTPIKFAPKRMDAPIFRSQLILALEKLRAQREYDALIGKKGTIVSGVVDRIEFLGYVVALGKAKTFKARGILPRSECIPTLAEKRKLAKGEAIRSCLVDITSTEQRNLTPQRLEDCSPRVRLSRTDTAFLRALLNENCPEIADGTVAIRAIVRSPGQQAKVGVLSNLKYVDAVGACLGPHSSRVRAISEELSGERIQIIHWSDDITTLIRNALAPASIVSCEVHIGVNGSKFAEVVTETQEDRRKAIGRDGINVRLASQLAGMRINVLDSQPSQKPSTTRSDIRINKLIEYIGVEDEFACRLVDYGYYSTFTISCSSVEDLSQIPGVDQDSAQVLIERAIEAVPQELEFLKETTKVEDDLIEALGRHNCLYMINELIGIGVRNMESARQIYELRGNTENPTVAISYLAEFLQLEDTPPTSADDNSP